MFRPDKPVVKALEQCSEIELTAIYNEVASLVVSHATSLINEEVEKQGRGKTFLDIQNDKGKDGKPKQKLVVTKETIEEWSAEMAKQAYIAIKNSYRIEGLEDAKELGLFYQEDLSETDKEEIFVQALKYQYGSILELPEPYND